TVDAAADRVAAQDAAALQCRRVVFAERVALHQQGPGVEVAREVDAIAEAVQVAADSRLKGQLAQDPGRLRVPEVRLVAHVAGEVRHVLHVAWGTRGGDDPAARVDYELAVFK